GAPPTTVSISPVTGGAPNGDGGTFNFGTQQIGSSSIQQLFTITNTGTENLIFALPAANIFGPQATDFQITSNGCFAAQIFNGGVAPGGSCTVGVVFAPIAANGTGPVSATLGFLENSATSPDNITLLGNATPAPVGGIVATPADLLFGPQGVGTTSLPLTETVTNETAAPVTIGALTTTGTNPGDFAAIVDTCSGVTL